MANSFTMVEESTFDALIKSVEDIKAMLAAQTCFSGYDASKIYTNSMMKSILGVGDKTLKKLVIIIFFPNIIQVRSYGTLKQISII